VDGVGHQAVIITSVQTLVQNFAAEATSTLFITTDL
jgi:hypothetical protein